MTSTTSHDRLFGTTGRADVPHLRTAACMLARAVAGMVAVAGLVSGCAQPIENPVVWDSKTSPPTIEPQMVDGKCALVISGTATVANRAISRVRLTVERGLAQVDVNLAPPSQWTSQTFHVVVPVEEQHVSVVYVGATRFPIWERGAGGKDCAR